MANPHKPETMYVVPTASVTYENESVVVDHVEEVLVYVAGPLAEDLKSFDEVPLPDDSSLQQISELQPVSVQEQ